MFQILYCLCFSAFASLSATNYLDHSVIEGPEQPVASMSGRTHNSARDFEQHSVVNIPTVPSINTVSDLQVALQCFRILFNTGFAIPTVVLGAANTDPYGQIISCSAASVMFFVAIFSTMHIMRPKVEKLFYKLESGGSLLALAGFGGFMVEQRVLPGTMTSAEQIASIAAAYLAANVLCYIIPPLKNHVDSCCT